MPRKATSHHGEGGGMVLGQHGTPRPLSWQPMTVSLQTRPPTQVEVPRHTPLTPFRSPFSKLSRGKEMMLFIF